MGRLSVIGTQRKIQQLAIDAQETYLNGACNDCAAAAVVAASWSLQMPHNESNKHGRNTGIEKKERIRNDDRQQ